MTGQLVLIKEVIDMAIMSYHGWLRSGQVIHDGIKLYSLTA